ncbi:exonuclease domain-containing protein [Alicyclobacillus macrosporangiidus]|uniref:Exonuclease n=1 Tax=Alicyclobacillus macrosporangiidus TaxID=392015 RepID=A0A1I7GJ94_9BACL|nr:exonuclease domain-containing protein [Alicyclobacillus macrosporangiidus]SFU48508.1 Exonuclease [Alicyclobacillus macrosporangiidus]
MAKKPPEGLAAFIDIETTGLRAGVDEIIQLSVALFRFKRDTGEILEIVDSYTGFQEPSGDIPREATRIHGITNEDVAGQRFDHARIHSIIEPAEFLVAHNATFDRGFLIYDFPWASEKKWKCSMRHVNWAAKGFKTKALQKLLEAHGIKVDKAHRADSDVKYAIELLNQDAGDGTRYFLEIVNHRALPRPREQEVLFIGSKRASAEPAASLEPLEQPSADRPPDTNPLYQPRRKWLPYAIFGVLAAALIACLVSFPYTTVLLIVFVILIARKASKKR